MAEKHIVEFHPSVIVTYCSEMKRGIFSVYDEGYPQRAYRNVPNTPGGNPRVINGVRDANPLATLERELEEEFNPNHAPEVKHGYTGVWAPEKDIELIRNGLIKNLRKHCDYFVDVKRIGDVEEKKNVPGTGIFSVFYTPVSESVIDCVDYNVNKHLRIVSEGNAGTFTIDQLVRGGEFSTAHLTSWILNDIFHSKIPNPGHITIIKKNSVRESYEDYLQDSDLEHKNSWLKF